MMTIAAAVVEEDRSLVPHHPSLPESLQAIMDKLMTKMPPVSSF